jgi:hypothetical protein
VLDDEKNREDRYAPGQVMRRGVIFSALFIALRFTSTSPAVESLSDDQAFQMIIGSWIRDSSRPDPLPSYAIEWLHHSIVTFDADGSGVFRIYFDETCRSITLSVKFAWGVKNGVLIERAADGQIGSQDEIVAIDKKSMTLRQLAAAPANQTREIIGNVEHRVRARDCVTPE